MNSSSSNQVIAYDNVTDVVGYVRSFGESIAKSQMFGCQSPAQGEVIAMECMARKLPPLTIAQRYHLISGKLSMKAETMLADFLAKGGKHKVNKRTPEEVSVTFTEPETHAGRAPTDHTCSFTWEDAKKEPFVYKGKEDEILDAIEKGQTDKLVLKAKYRSPRSRMQMLWARLISDSIRFIDPTITSGTYTPEEIEDFDEEPIGKISAANTPPAEEIIEAEVVETKTEPAEPDSTDATKDETPPAEGNSSGNDATTPGGDSGSSEMRTDEPCLEAQVDRIKTAIATAKQIPGNEDIATRIKTKLKDAGLQKIAELTSKEADLLLVSIESKQAEKFFEADLAGYAKN